MRNLIYIMLMLPSITLAQDPNWEVDIARFEHRMTITAVLNVGGVESIDSEDIIAAFIGDELKGLARPDVTHEASARQLAFLQVGNDIPSGETITFQFYDSSTGRVSTAIVTEMFESGKVLGSVNSPYIISDVVVPPSTGLLINNYVSPNNDLINDYLEIEDIESYVGFTLSIFSPSGELIFQTNQYNNEWDGTRNGKTLPSGVYYYSFTNTTIDVSYKGIISLKTD